MCGHHNSWREFGAFDYLYISFPQISKYSVTRLSADPNDRFINVCIQLYWHCCFQCSYIFQIPHMMGNLWVEFLLNLQHCPNRTWHLNDSDYAYAYLGKILVASLSLKTFSWLNFQHQYFQWKPSKTKTLITKVVLGNNLGSEIFMLLIQ